MRKFIAIGLILGLVLFTALTSSAQETATPTGEATVEVTEETPEATEETPEATGEPTDEATPEATEGTAEVTPEVTVSGTATSVPAVSVTPSAAIIPGDGASISVSDQIVLNGMVMIDSVTATVPGFVSIFATDVNGANAHLVGIAPVEAGTTEDVPVMIDGATATPFLTAQLHTDDNQPGVFEFGTVLGADMPLTGADAAFPAASAFKIAGIFSYDQQPMDNTVVIASVISEIGGWLVVHAEENGQPGMVLGQTPLIPGTNLAVRVTLAANGQTPVVWPMIHADDTTLGTFEFGSVDGADLPLFLGKVTATRPMALTETPTVLLSDSTPLTPLSTLMIPAVSASEQVFDAAVDPNVNFVVDNVTSLGPGFVDVHADAGGHPSGSLGNAPVLDGTNADVTVLLTPIIAMPITPVVWPMLHSDTDGNGIYEYLMIPGTDLPVVYNGAAVTAPVNISGSAIEPVIPTDITAVPTIAVSPTPAVTATGSPEGTVETTPEATEGTAEPTDEVTAEPTDEATPEATEGTAEATPELTETATATP